ncbi:hypothetical protein TN53_24895 [Streptomyces sp. WM6386]|nr:hypothetical protein TN53_24895 [Streptomyces sp. WM6386]
MTILQMPPRTAVRRAGLVDVPAVVRLFAMPEHSAVDRDQAQRAMRLMLAHYALEEGQVWVAERADGTLLAAAVWLPPGTESPHTRFSGLFARELAAPLPQEPVLPTALKRAKPDAPHWSVVTVCTPDDSEAWDRRVVSDLLSPGLHTADEEGADAVAVTLSPRHMDPLRPLGFRAPHQVPFAEGAGVWLATRRPVPRLAA